MIDDYPLLLEAQAIARGLLHKPPRRAHLEALLALIDALQHAHDERLDVIETLMRKPCARVN